jgi:hypothetical protein
MDLGAAEDVVAFVEIGKVTLGDKLLEIGVVIERTI